MKHDYKADCQCYRCKGIRNDPRTKRQARRVRKLRDRSASKAERHGRYLDCGPQNWDEK